MFFLKFGMRHGGLSSSAPEVGSNVLGMNRESDGIQIRLAVPEDCTRINIFHNSYYRTERTRAQWEWEFRRGAPTSAVLPIAVAELEGRIVGTQALILIEMLDRHGPFLAAKSEETLVDPSMRGRNLFVRLYEPLLAHARDLGVRNIWGFTPARTAFVKAGFDAPMQTSQIFLSLRSGAARALVEGFGRSFAKRLFAVTASTVLVLYGHMRASLSRCRDWRAVSVRLLDESPEWADELSQRFLQQWGGTTIRRSQAYLRWRIFENPYVRPLFLAAFEDDEPVGFACLAMVQPRVAMLVDVFVVDSRSGKLSAATVVEALMRNCARRAQSMGAVAIRGWSVTSHPFDKLVRKVAGRLGWLYLRRGNDMIYRQVGGAEAPPKMPPDQWFISRIYTEGVQG